VFIAQIGGDVRASNLGRRSHQVIALAATGQLGVAATGQIRLAVITAAPGGHITDYGTRGALHRRRHPVVSPSVPLCALLVVAHNPAIGLGDGAAQPAWADHSTLITAEFAVSALIDER